MDQVTTRLHDAKLGSAIEDACEKLPDDCIINIALENGAATVTLNVAGIETDFPTDYDSLPGEIRDALKFVMNRGE